VRTVLQQGELLRWRRDNK
jgi:hypothetical protein